MDLVKTSGRFIVWFEISFFIFFIPENISNRAVTGGQTIAVPVQSWLKFLVKDGETRFNNTCQDITLDEVKKICNKTQEYLQKIINEYEGCLNNIHSRLVQNV